MLALFFLIAGGSRTAQETFKYLCQPDERAAFLIAAFGWAAVGAIVVQIFRRRLPSVLECGVGTVLGLANIAQTFCILKALEHYPGFIVFPVTSAGGLVFTTAVATMFLEERLSWHSYTGIGLATCSLALLYPAG